MCHRALAAATRALAGAETSAAICVKIATASTLTKSTLARAFRDVSACEGPPRFCFFIFILVPYPLF